MSATGPPPSGEILAGKYRVEAQIGEGGMGWVFAARHVELDTRVAVKVLRPDAMVKPEYRERFRREARVVASLESDHVARVMDFGTLESGGLYVVMELLEGRDLEAELRARGPLPIAEAVHYLLEACEGIAEAHARNVVHRDLKPNNLFLVNRVDGRRVVKVLDFGLAKKKDTPVGEDSLTQFSDVIGTPHYMAPEQLLSAKEIDRRADIWGLGISLYELLTGALPFDASGDIALLSSILQAEARPIHELRPDIPRELEVVVARCMFKSPEQRFQNVLELAGALEPFANDTAASGIVRRIHAILSRAAGQPLPWPTRAALPSVTTDPRRTQPPAAVRSASSAIPRELWIGAAAAGVIVLAGVAFLLFRELRTPMEIVPPAQATLPDGAAIAPDATAPSSAR